MAGLEEEFLQSINPGGGPNRLAENLLVSMRRAISRMRENRRRRGGSVEIKRERLLACW